MSATAVDPSGGDTERFRANLSDELNSAALYEALAAAEREPTRAAVFRGLAAAERDHATFWRQHLESFGQPVPTSAPSVRTKLLVALICWFGPAFVLPSITSAEFADRNKYAGQTDAASAGLTAEEHGHAAVLSAVLQRSGLSGTEIARSERWHRSASGNDLRAAVLGANDGLVSNFCLVLGVAGGAADQRTIFLTGVAGLVAGACSMALGEWLSVTNAREMVETQLACEARELAETPEAEQRELALIYQAKGLSEVEANRVAARIVADPKMALDTLAREELGIDPAELGGIPWSAAAISFLLFAVGAAVPVAPFALAKGSAAMVGSVVAACIALLLLGAATSLFNGRSPTFSAVRQVAIGAAEAAVTFGAGRLFGAVVG